MRAEAAAVLASALGETARATGLGRPPLSWPAVRSLRRFSVTHALVLLMALLIGVVAGLRSMTAPTVVAWAAFLGWINLHSTWASWVANVITVAVLTVLAVGELVTDKLPKTPARTVPPVVT